MKKFLSAILLGVSLLFVSGGCLFHHTCTQEQYQSMIANTQEMIITYEYRNANIKEERWDKAEKRGVLTDIGNGYAIGLTHVFGIDTVLAFTPFGAFEIETSDTRNVVCKTDSGDEVFLVGSEGDIQIFKYKNNVSKHMKANFEWADYDRLEIGQEIFITGDPRLMGAMVREGIVSRKDFEMPVAPGFYRDPVVVITIELIEGDSGSPVYVYEDGVLKMIGLAQASLPGLNQGYILHSGYVQDVIRRIAPEVVFG